MPMSGAKPPQNRRGNGTRAYRSHGFTEAKAAIQRVGERSIHEALDGRTRTGRALIAWRDALVEDLGGLENVSAMQLQLIELPCRQKLLLDSIDGWLLQQDSLVNKRDRKLFNVVRERQTVANALASYQRAPAYVMTASADSRALPRWAACLAVL